MELFHLVAGDGPLVATAIHSGHAVSPEAAVWLALDEPTRLREEDPYTDDLAALAPTRVVGRRSRFEFDLNRSREQAIYRKPADAWGLRVWNGELPAELAAASLADYDAFYATTHALLKSLVARHGRIVVLDLHSYNHRRNGADGPLASTADNPEINVGTASVDRRLWGPLVDRFLNDMRHPTSVARTFDVRENVKFFGGHFPRWINGEFPGQACALAVEFKKTFMDEWTGELDTANFAAIKFALAATFAGLHEELGKLTTTGLVPSP